MQKFCQTFLLILQKKIWNYIKILKIQSSERIGFKFCQIDFINRFLVKASQFWTIVFFRCPNFDTWNLLYENFRYLIGVF